MDFFSDFETGITIDSKPHSVNLMISLSSQLLRLEMTVAVSTLQSLRWQVNVTDCDEMSDMHRLNINRLDVITVA